MEQDVSWQKNKQLPKTSKLVWAQVLIQLMGSSFEKMALTEFLHGKRNFPRIS